MTIYFITSNDQPLIGIIGREEYSLDPLQSLQADSATPLRIIGTLDGNAQDARRLRDHFAQLSATHHGVWFTPTRPLLHFILSYAHLWPHQWPNDVRPVQGPLFDLLAEQPLAHIRPRWHRATQAQQLEWLGEVAAVRAWLRFALFVAQHFVATQPEKAHALIVSQRLTQLTRLTPQGIVELAALIEQGGLGLHLPDQQIPWRVALGLLPNEDEEDDPYVD